MSEEAEQTEQTTSAPEQKFGREAVEAEAGWQPLDVGPKVDADREAVAAAIGLNKDQIPPPRQEQEAPYRPLINPTTGEEISDNTSLTVEQAAEMVSRNQAIERESDQYTNAIELQAAIDDVHRQPA
jgi:hypothetical protein